MLLQMTLFHFFTWKSWVIFYCSYTPCLLYSFICWWTFKSFPCAVCIWSLSRVQLFATPWSVATRLLCPWGFSKQEYWSGLPCPPLGDLPNQGIKPGLLHCRQILYHLSHQGSWWILEWVTFLFQGIFPTQESNQGLLHCRWILYQLSYQGSPSCLKSLP